MSFSHTIRLTAAIVVALIINKPAAAQDADDIYWGMALGAYFTSDNESGNADVEFDTGVLGAVQFGYVFEKVRADLELEYSRADIDEIGNAKVDADLQTYRSTLSLYLDCPELFRYAVELAAAGVKKLIKSFPNYRPACVDIIPYGGVGMGVAHQALNGDLDDDRTSFTTHLEGGFSFASNRHLQLGLAYRWTWFENDLDGLEDAASSHQVRLGARFFY